MVISVGLDSANNNVDLDSDSASIHVLGTPGMGKSHLLASLAEQANQNGEGVLLIDIKDGELAQQLAGRTSRPQDVIYFAPGLVDEGMTWSINLLKGDHTLVVDQTMEMFDRNDVFHEAMTQVKQHLRMGIYLALQDDAPTLKTVLDVLVNPMERRRIMAIAQERKQRGRGEDGVQVLDPDVFYFWRDFESQGKRDDSNNRDQRSQIESTAVRLRELLIGDPLGALLKSHESGFLLDEWLDEGKMVLCDLSASTKGMPMRQARQMANIIIAFFVNRAIARQITPESRTWRIIADEFDQLATESFVHAIDKLRSKKVTSVLAHQNFEQISNRRLSASLASQQVKIYFRVAVSDRATLVHRFGKAEADDIVNLPRYQARLIQGPDDVEQSSDDKLWFITKPKEVSIVAGQTVSTYDWWNPFSQEQYQEIVERSKAYTQPRHDTMEEYDADPGNEPEDSGEATGESTPQSGALTASTATGGYKSGGEDPSGAGQIPNSEQSAGSRPPVRQHDEQSQEAIHPSRSQRRGRSITPASLRVRVDNQGDGVSAVQKPQVDGYRQGSSEPTEQDRSTSSQTNAGGNPGSSLPPPMDP